jgi:hypothetical protein
MKQVRLDIIGCGSVVQMTHAKILNTVKSFGVRPLGCFDVNPLLSDLISSQLSCHKYETDKLLFESPADAVLIATPPSSHFALASQALDKGKWVLCEKPFTTTKREAETLVSTAKAKGVGILVGHFRRAFPSLHVARDFLKDRLAEVMSVEAFEGGRFSWITESGYVSQEKYGNVTFDTGSHLIDMVLYALSLDRAECDYVIKDVRGFPLTGVSHEIHLRMDLCASSVKVPVKVRLSRYRPDLNVIRIKMREEELQVRTSFREAALIKAGKRFFELGAKEPGPFRPQNLYDCFALEYMLLRSSMTKSTVVEDMFDGSRFVTLAGILEGVSDWKLPAHRSQTDHRS